MREFSFVSAWGLGVRFFSGRALSHAILLAGVGVLVPFVLQYMLVPVPAEADPSPLATDAITALAAAGTTGAVVFAVGYLLQAASLFASWRLGFAGSESVAGATLYGMFAGLLTFGGSALLVVAIGVGLGLVALPLGALAGAVALLVALATLFTTLAALVAVGITVLLGLAMVFGAATGNTGLAATLVGGSGFIAVLLIVAAGVMLWLAARLSCTTAIMAQRRSFNLFAAMAESWSLTWDDEWRILRYLLLIGLAVALVMVGVTMLAGAGITMAQAGEPSDGGLVDALIQFAFAIPFAFLSVLVPAGIYRELAGTPAPVEVFA